MRLVRGSPSISVQGVLVSYRAAPAQKISIVAPGEPPWMLEPGIVRECSAMSPDACWSRLISLGVVDSSWAYDPTRRLHLHPSTPIGYQPMRVVSDQNAPPIGAQAMSLALPPSRKAALFGGIAAAALAGGAALALSRAASGQGESTGGRSKAAEAGRGALQGLQTAMSVLVPSSAGDAGPRPWTSLHAVRMAGSMPSLREAETVAGRLMEAIGQTGQAARSWKIVWQIADPDFDAPFCPSIVLTRADDRAPPPGEIRTLRGWLSWIADGSATSRGRGPLRIAQEVVKLGVIPVRIESDRIVLAIRSRQSNVPLA